MFLFIISKTVKRKEGNVLFNNTLHVIFYGYISVTIYIENTTRVPVGDDLSYNEWFLKRI